MSLPLQLMESKEILHEGVNEMGLHQDGAGQKYLGLS